MTEPVELITGIANMNLNSFADMQTYLKSNNTDLHSYLKAKGTDLKSYLQTLTESDLISYLNSLPLIDGRLLTKHKRLEMFGSVIRSDSKRPENYQRLNVVKHTGIECRKTNIRINLRSSDLTSITNKKLEQKNDRLDYTEDFDGIQIISHPTHPKKIYINFKSIVEGGGSQTRSLREVYWFIEGQLKVLLKLASANASNTEEIYFANILDGEECSNKEPQFNYLLDMPEYATIKNKVYVGDLKTYCLTWFPQNFGTSASSAEATS